MDARSSEVIRKKLDYLEQTLAEIEPYLRTSYAEYAGRPAHRRVTERLVQITFEIAADTSDLLVQAAGRRAPGSMREALSAIRELGVIDDALFERFSRTYVGLATASFTITRRWTIGSCLMQPGACAKMSWPF